MSENFDFEATLKAMQSGQTITAKMACRRRW